MANFIKEQYIRIATFITNQLKTQGERVYIGESITTLEHMLQSALLAESMHLDNELIIGCLPHDYGHLFEKTIDNSMGGFGTMDHEGLGASYLQRMGFSQRVIAVVKNHVAAKRYLCFASKGYYNQLSTASKETLRFQGGIMSLEEAKAFEQFAFFDDIIQVRKIDELAKDVLEIDASVLLDKYEKLINTHLVSQRMLQKKMVVFDMAGTTIEENNVVYKTLLDVLILYGFQVDLETVITHGAGKEKKEALLGILFAIGETIDEGLLNKVFFRFKEMLNNVYHTINVEQKPNAEQVFKTLREADIKVVLNTGFDKAMATLILDKIGWQQKEHYDLLITASDVAISRPAPDMIHTAMKILSINNAATVVKVGDSIVDIEEGKNAGCGLSIGITGGSTDKKVLEQANPDYIINDLASLPSLILV